MTAADRIPVKYNSPQRESPLSRKETTTMCTQGSSSCSQLKINTLCLCTVLFNRDLDNLNNFLGNTPGEVGLSSFPHYKWKGDCPESHRYSVSESHPLALHQACPTGQCSFLGSTIAFKNLF